MSLFISEAHAQTAGGGGQGGGFEMLLRTATTNNTHTRILCVAARSPEQCVCVCESGSRPA